MPRSLSLHDNIHSILGAIRSVPVPAKPAGEDAPSLAAPFITVSRQPGAGAWTMAAQLIDALNAALPGEQPWTCWDRELVEKVAADAHLSAQVIESLEDRGHSWFSDFLASLSLNDQSGASDESRVYVRVAQAIRALAQAGRVVLVGRAAALITRKMPGGIHIRLVAPFEQRVAFMAREHHLSPDKAASQVKQMEHNRVAFYRRYWPNETLSPETFALTINTGAVDTPTMIQMITMLVRCKVASH